MVSQQVTTALKDAQVQSAILDSARGLWDAGRSPHPENTNTFKDDLLVDPLGLKASAVRTGVAVIRGYVDQEGENVRVFASLTLSDYIDIPRDDVVLIVDLRSAVDRLAGQAVWVRLDANIVRGRLGVQKQLLQVDLLGGDIASGGGRGGGGYSPSPWCATNTRGGGGYSPSPWCGGGYSPSPWCSG